MRKLFSESFGQGPNIVLLHGWGIHSGIWQFVVNELSKDFCVTIVDLPGFGRSEMISDFTMLNIVEKLLRVVPNQAVWIGWSLGGLIATKFALLHPDRVKKLICVASTPKFVKERGWPGIDLSILQKFNEQLEVNYEATLTRFLLLQFYGMTLDGEVIRWLNLNLFLYGRPKPHTLNAGLNLLEKEDLRKELADLQCPIMYILGKKDTLVPPQLTKALTKLAPNIQSVVFPKASHALFISHKKEFLSEVRQFLYE